MHIGVHSRVHSRVHIGFFVESTAGLTVGCTLGFTVGCTTDNDGLIMRQHRQLLLCHAYSILTDKWQTACGPAPGSCCCGTPAVLDRQ